MKVRNQNSAQEGLDLNLGVVIPVFGREKVLMLTLESLARQRFPNPFRVYLIDQDGSINFSALAERFSGRLDLNYYDDRAFTTVSRKRNIGIALSKDDVIVLLDSDMVVGPMFLLEHLHAHKSESTVVVGYVYGVESGYNRRPLDQLAPDDYDDFLQEIEHFKHSWPDARDPWYRVVNDAIMKMDAPWNVFWTGNISINRTMLPYAGFFDERFRGWGYEDVELGYRLVRSGATLKLNREAWSVHLSQEVSGDGRRVEADKNLRYFVSKYMSLECELYCRYFDSWKKVLPIFDSANYEPLIGIHAEELVQIDVMNHSKVMQLGYDPLLTNFSQVTLVLEPRSKEVDLAKRLPAKIVHQLAGLCLPFSADDFDRVIVTPVWTAYPEKARQRLMKELIRVAPHLTFLSDNRRESALDSLKAEIELPDVSVEMKKIGKLRSLTISRDTVESKTHMGRSLLT